MTNNNKIQSVLFDLDGTLLDSAPDMYSALENLCEAEQIQTPAYLDAQNRISQGVAGLLDLTFNISTEHPDFITKRDAYLNCYSEVLGQKSQLFPGMEQCIDYLNNAQIPWGIVTSKVYRFAHPLLKVSPFLASSQCLIAGDTVTPGKPDPAPLFEACKQLGVDAATSIYIGDAEKDIVAGNSAGMKTIIAGWGYISKKLTPEKWQADYRENNSLNLIDLLKTL